MLIIVRESFLFYSVIFAFDNIPRLLKFCCFLSEFYNSKSFYFLPGFIKLVGSFPYDSNLE